MYMIRTACAESILRPVSLAAIEGAGSGRLEVVLGSYQKMQKYAKELAGVSWSVIIWDEGE
mgnify:CR=1 FL=1